MNQSLCGAKPRAHTTVCTGVIYGHLSPESRFDNGLFLWWISLLFFEEDVKQECVCLEA